MCCLLRLCLGDKGCSEFGLGELDRAAGFMKLVCFEGVMVLDVVLVRIFYALSP